MQKIIKYIVFLWLSYFFISKCFIAFVNHDIPSIILNGIFFIFLLMIFIPLEIYSYKYKNNNEG